MNPPAVSVLLAVYNGGDLLRPAVQSILTQTLQDWELVVVDDGSSDQTADILRSLADPRIRVLRNERNIGLTRSLNRGLEAARGRYIARQDADDLSEPTRLEQQLGFLQTHPEVQLLGTSSWRMNSSGRLIGSNDLPTTHSAIRWACLVDNAFLHTSVLFPRNTILREFGGYDEQFAVCQDYALWTRIAARYPVANLPGRLVRMREHACSMTRTQVTRTDQEAQRAARFHRSTVFPGRSWSEQEHHLLDLFRLPFAPEKLEPLCSLLARLREEFEAANPELRRSRDFRALLCRQSLRLAYKFSASTPRAALTEILRALDLSPGEWIRQGFTVLGRQWP